MDNLMRSLIVFSTVLLSILTLSALQYALTYSVRGLEMVSSPTEFFVNSDIDATAANPGDGVCETEAGNDVCTLRAAIQEANALPVSVTIHLPAGVYTLTISGHDFDAAMGDLNITDNLTIIGAGSESTIVNGNEIDRVFDVRMSPGKQVTISDLTIMNGGSTSPGAGICLCTEDTFLYLNRVVIRNNQNFVAGGGVYSVGNLVIVDSVIQENSTGHSGGGINNTGTAILSRTLILSNTAPFDGFGGGIRNTGVLTVTNSTIQGNSVQLFNMFSTGGGIVNQGSDASLTVENSLISKNLSTSGYGGLVNYEGTVRLVNVTASQNQGGILQGTQGVMVITNTTVVDNAYNGSVRVNLYSAGSLSITNSIIAGDDAESNCLGTITSLGHNLDSGNSCNLNNTGDLTDTNPLLGPLQWNGGDTWTYELLPDSPAINAGNNFHCPSFDQRGISRPQGVACDIGAYEFEITGPTAFPDTITTTVNVGILIDVLANDLPGENGPTEINSVGLPLSGTAVISDTFIFYTPSVDFVGIDTFTYTISDTLLEDTALVTVIVLPVEIEENHILYLPIILKPDN
jgi:CSLREA domain-containing protein